MNRRPRRPFSGVSFFSFPGVRFFSRFFPSFLPVFMVRGAGGMLVVGGERM